MTVVSEDSRTGPYTGNGSTTVFAYDFKVAVQTDLVVTLTITATGVETVQTITTHYTVSGVGDEGGGNITMVTAPASTETLTVTRAVAKTQTTDLVNRGSVQPNTLEDAFDKLTQLVQDQQEQLDRMLRFTVSADLTSFTLDIPKPVASKGIAITAAGTAFELVDLPASALAGAQTAQAAAETAQTAAEAALDTFDDIFLGAKSSNPTLDNDGDALAEGQLYYNTGTNLLMSYDGATWNNSASGISVSMAPVVDASSLAVGRTAMGLEIGLNVLAYDADTLKADVGDTITAAGFDSADVTTTYSSTITLDPKVGNFQKITMTGASTVTIPVATSLSMIVDFLQDSTGGRVVTWSGADLVRGTQNTTLSKIGRARIQVVSGQAVVNWEDGSDA